MKYAAAALLTVLTFSSPAQSQITIDLGKVLQNQSQAPRTADIEKMQSSVKVENIVFEKESENSTSRVRVSLDVTNVTDKTIAGIKVSIQALNVFGDLLDRAHLLSSDADIAPGQTSTLSAITLAERYLASDKSKVTFTASPSHIVFSDGETLKAK